MRGLCRRADLILPNATEAALLLEREPQTDAFDDASAQALADELLTLAPSAVVTGLALGKYIGCAGSGRERFVIKNCTSAAASRARVICTVPCSLAR